MRTTVTIDPDVAEKLKEYAHKRKLPFKQALNELLRRGLKAQSIVKKKARFRVQPHDGGFRPGIDPGKLNQLLDELEVGNFVGKARDDQ